MKNEDEIQQLIQLEAPKENARLLRNNSGALEDKNGRVVRFGLGNSSSTINEKFKSSDLIGFTKVTITSDMVGKTVAIFTAVEVKKEDWKFSKTDKRAVAQNNFIEWVKAAGGYAGFANSVDKFRKIIGK